MNSLKVLTFMKLFEDLDFKTQYEAIETLTKSRVYNEYIRKKTLERRMQGFVSVARRIIQKDTEKYSEKILAIGDWQNFCETNIWCLQKTLWKTSSNWPWCGKNQDGLIIFHTNRGHELYTGEIIPCTDELIDANTNFYMYKNNQLVPWSF